MEPTTQGISVTVQSTQRPGRPLRWGYVLNVPGEWADVSAFRYSSPESAMAAGKKASQ